MKLSKDQKAAIRRIAQRHRLELVIAFGSQVTEKTHSESDLDIAVLPAGKAVSFREFAALSSDLGKVFTGKKVDLCFVNRADPLLLKKISETAFLLYGNHRSFEEFKCYAFKRFEDYKPYFKLEEQFVRRYIKELGLAGR